MNHQRPLTALAHELLAQHLKAGDKAIDATMGNGHDTLFLAEQVGPTGQVQAFDIQPQALAQTQARLRAQGLTERVQLHPCGHQHMQQTVPEHWQGATAAVTFNLGYLPGSDKTVTTLPRHTLMALDQALRYLQPGGKLSILAYRGHPGGKTETHQVLTWLQHQQHLTQETYESPGPMLLMATRRTATD